MLYIEGRRFWTNMLEVQDDWFWPPFFKIYALESRYIVKWAQKKQWTVHNTLMWAYTCLVITCKWPTSGHFWLCDRKNHLHMWCLSVSLAPHLSPPVFFFRSPLFDFDHGCICLHPLGWLLHPCHTKTEPSGASFLSTECRPYQHQVDILLSPLPLLTFFSLSVFVVLRHYLPLKWFLVVQKVKNATFCAFGVN